MEEKSSNYKQNWEVVEKSPASTHLDSLFENSKTSAAEIESTKIDEIALEEAIQKIKEDAEIKFITTLREQNWQDFEDFCSQLLEKMGYGVSGIREKRTRDGGIDGVIYTDELGIKDKVYIQAKRYQDGNTVGSKDIQAFLHIVNEAKSKGIFITTSKFSPDAKKVAEVYQKNGTIALIDDNMLIKLCLKHKHGFKVKKVLEIMTSAL